MSTLAWIFTGYGAVALGLWRWLGRWFTEERSADDWTDLFWLVVAVTVTAATWALWLVPALVRLLSHGDHRRAQRLLVGESRKAKAKRQAERIAALEKELELHG